MLTDITYKPNTDDIIYQEIDGEIILLNLKNGNYFSLDNLGALIWKAVCEEISVNLIMSVLSEISPAEKVQIVFSVSELFELLLIEDLIVESDKHNADEQCFNRLLNNSFASPNFQFKPAKLNSYKNIQEKYAHPCGIKEK
jgi:hypothetical protein